MLEAARIDAESFGPFQELLSSRNETNVRRGFSFIENSLSAEDQSSIIAVYKHPLLRYKLGSYRRFHPLDFNGRKPRLIPDHFDSLERTARAMVRDAKKLSAVLRGISIIRKEVLQIDAASEGSILSTRVIYRNPMLLGLNRGPGHEDEIGEGSNIFLSRIIRNFSGPGTCFPKTDIPDGATTYHWGAQYHWEPPCKKGVARCSLLLEMGATLLK